MRNIRKLSILLALCLVLALLPVTAVTAAETGSLWMNQMLHQDGLTIAVCADTTVSSGVISITYDSENLTFEELTVDSTHVMLYALNDQQAGVVRISWIGTDAEAGGEGYVLMRLRFIGTVGQSGAVLEGSVQNADDEDIAITVLDFTELAVAIAQAVNVRAEDYTADSYAAMLPALQEANALMELETVTQVQLDAAAKKLVAAVDNLVVFTPEPPPTEPPATEPAPTEPAPTEPAPTEPAPTEPAPTEPTQPGSTPAKPDSTQPSTQAPTIAPKRDNSWMLITLAAALVVAVVAAVVILKKRGRK